MLAPALQTRCGQPKEESSREAVPSLADLLDLDCPGRSDPPRSFQRQRHSRRTYTLAIKSCQSVRHRQIFFGTYQRLLARTAPFNMMSGATTAGRDLISIGDATARQSRLQHDADMDTGSAVKADATHSLEAPSLQDISSMLTLVLEP
jgi:hypothetical protein